MGFEKAPAKADEAVKVVAPRNDPKTRPVFAKATIADEANQAAPGKVRKWFHATEKNHPGFWEKFVVQHRVGDPEIGYCTAQPWTVVSNVGATGRPRDDQGKPIDTSLRHGDLICLETDEANAAIYDERDRLKDEAKSLRLRNGDNEQINTGGQGSANYRARVQTGFTGTPQQLLNGEG